MRTVFWEDNSLKLINQRKLPDTLEIISFHNHMEVINAIKIMIVRGAPAIGVAGAFALALAANKIQGDSLSTFLERLEEASLQIKNSRPTAINLSWAVNRIMKKLKDAKCTVDELRLLVLLEAQKLADEDVITNKAIGKFGADLIDDGDTIVHHCNTGALAAVDWGTALGVIRTAHEQGKQIHVLVDETRPRMQDARLTAWELQQYGISHEIITDNMAGYFLETGMANKVLFGADCIAANGDVVNKIGSYMLSLAAFDNIVPVYCVAPMSSIDYSISNGNQIPIEERDPEEVLGLSVNGESLFPKGARVRNPAFDLTPNRLISAIITERGIIRQPFEANLLSLRGC